MKIVDWTTQRVAKISFALALGLCACGASSGGGAGGGTPYTTLGRAFGLTRFASDANNLYWTSGLSPYQVAKTGGTPLMLGQSLLQGPGLAVDAAFVYTSSTQGIQRVPIGDGTIQKLADAPMGVDIVTDATNVYWVDTPSGSLAAMPKAGGFPITSGVSGSHQGAHITLKGPTAYWISNMTVRSQALDLSSCKGAAPGACAASTAIVTDADDMGQGGFAVDATNVYWTDLIASSIKKAPIGGGPATVIVDRTTAPDAVTEPLSLAVDDQFLYWVTQRSQTLWKIPLGGGTPIAVATDPKVSDTFAVFVDSDVIAWGGNGNVDIIKR